MGLTLLHTADWQIGKRFAHIAGDAGAALRTQRLETVRSLARLAQEQRVDAVLVAGDVFVILRQDLMLSRVPTKMGSPPCCLPFVRLFSFVIRVLSLGHIDPTVNTSVHG